MQYIEKKSTVILPSVKGNITDTQNVTDKITNAPSLRLVEELIGEGGSSVVVENSLTSGSTTNAPSVAAVAAAIGDINTILDTISGEVV